MGRRKPIGSITAAVITLGVWITSSLGSAAAAPRMVIPEKTFDFKEVEEGRLLEHAFTVINKGDQPLRIKDVKPG